MRDAVAETLAHARQVRDAVVKTIWASPAGKKRLADRLAALLPAHKVYVEPFAGSAAVFFAKPPSEVEVLNDIDHDTMEAFRIVKSLTPEQLEKLRSLPWEADEKTYYRIYDSNPADDVERLHRFLYVRAFSYGKLSHRSFSRPHQGMHATSLRRLERWAPRLKQVVLHEGDYEPVVRKYDSADTVFYFDPPYRGYDTEVGEDEFDEKRFLSVLKSIRGRFLLTYGVRGRLAKALEKEGYFVQRIRTRRRIGYLPGIRDGATMTHVIASNYRLDTNRVTASVAPVGGGGAFRTTAKLLKQIDPSDERYVLGIVLEPEVVDAQGDVYSAEEIRQAAHRFMEDFGGLGLMHRMRVNGQVKVLESYLAPADFVIGETQVRKGTWLLAVRILSDELWEMVKTGELTGFSIGGSARRLPVSEGTDESVTEAA